MVSVIGLTYTELEKKLYSCLINDANHVKEALSRSCKQAWCFYNLYCFMHVFVVICTSFGGWGESTIK